MNNAEAPAATLDHVVLAAASLDEGVDWCERTLGVTPGAGGAHPLMGTHNRLFNIGSQRFADCFFEVLAIDPAAPRPPRPRWFGLDRLDLRQGPRLVNVVARCRSIERHLQALAHVGARPGTALRASRQTAAGLLQWRIAVNDDGELDGALPTLIEWDDEAMQPARRMPDSGITLRRVALRGLSLAVQQALNLAAADISPGATALRVELDTPRGAVTLQSP